jgi:hypothetical protein
MELTYKDIDQVTILFESKEENLIQLALMFSGVLTKGGIDKNTKESIFEGSRGVYSIKDSLDPHAKQRIEQNARERMESRSRGEKWKRKGRYITGPIYVQLTRGDVLGLKRLIDILVAKDLFIEQLEQFKKGTKSDVFEIRDALGDIIASLQN